MLDGLFDQVLYYYKLPLSTCLLATNIYLFDILFKKGSFKDQELQRWIFVAYSGYEVLVFPGWKSQFSQKSGQSWEPKESRPSFFIWNSLL